MKCNFESATILVAIASARLRPRKRPETKAAYMCMAAYYYLYGPQLDAKTEHVPSLMFVALLNTRGVPKVMKFDMWLFILLFNDIKYINYKTYKLKPT